MKTDKQINNIPMWRLICYIKHNSGRYNEITNNKGDWNEFIDSFNKMCNIFKEINIYEKGDIIDIDDFQCKVISLENGCGECPTSRLRLYPEIDNIQEACKICKKHLFRSNLCLEITKFKK